MFLTLKGMTSSLVVLIWKSTHPRAYSSWRNSLFSQPVYRHCVGVVRWNQVTAGSTATGSLELRLCHQQISPNKSGGWKKIQNLRVTRYQGKQLTYAVVKTEIHIIIDNAQRPFGVLLLEVIRVHFTHKWNTVVLIKFLNVLGFGIFTLLLKLTYKNTD